MKALDHTNEPNPPAVESLLAVLAMPNMMLMRLFILGFFGFLAWMLPFIVVMRLLPSTDYPGWAMASVMAVGLLNVLNVVRLSYIYFTTIGEDFVDNRDWFTWLMTGVIYSCVLSVPLLVDIPQDKQLYVANLLAIGSIAFNRFHWSISLPFLITSTIVYGVLANVEEWLMFICFVGTQQATLWFLGRGFVIENNLRRKINRENKELKLTQNLLSISARQNERLRISHDIHDQMGHDLASLNIQLQICQQIADEKVLSHLQQAQQSCNALFHNLRDTVYQLRDEHQQHFYSALLEMVNAVPHLHIDLECIDDLRVNGKGNEILLRSIQECITNTLKHSSATNMKITLSQGKDLMRIVIEDNGVAKTHKVKSGTGLTSIRQRIESLQGTVKINPYTQAGFHVLIEVPSKELAQGNR